MKIGALVLGAELQGRAGRATMTLLGTDRAWITFSRGHNGTAK